MHAAKTTLADFSPDSIWFTSLGSPTGTTITINGKITDDMGESWVIEDEWSGVPESINADELTGFVNAAGDMWNWDGYGNPCDWNANTIRSLAARRKESR